MRPQEDAYGQAMLDRFHGRESWEIVERDDGFFIDLSPATVETRRLRGVTDARVMSIDAIDSSLGPSTPS